MNSIHSTRIRWMLLAASIAIVLYCFVPVVAQIVQKLVNLSGIKNLTIKLLLYQVGLVVIGLLVELLFVPKSESSLKKLILNPSKSALNDLISWGFTLFNLENFFFVFCTFGIFHFLMSKFVEILPFSKPFLTIQSPIILFVIILILSDLKNYIWHRIMHNKIFWSLHAFHHSATEFTILTTYRTHFLQKIVSVVLDTFLFIIFNVPTIQFFYLRALQDIQQILQHSNVNWNWGWIGRWVFVSPNAHKIHHSTNPMHFDKNYGNFLIIWDRIFGTYAPLEHRIEIGIPTNPYNQSNYFSDIFRGILDLKTAFFGLFSPKK